MSYVLFFFLGGMLMGVVGVVSNPSPFFGAIAMVLAAGMGCGVLVGHGGVFLSLVLFLIYLGGMLVVFAYSAALAADPFPEAWGSYSVMKFVAVYLAGTVVMGLLLGEGWTENPWFMVEEWGEFTNFRGDTEGVGLMYGEGGKMMAISVWAILVVLFVVLELVRGCGKGALRAI